MKCERKCRKKHVYFLAEVPGTGEEGGRGVRAGGGMGRVGSTVDSLLMSPIKLFFSVKQKIPSRGQSKIS